MTSINRRLLIVMVMIVSAVVAGGFRLRAEEKPRTPIENASGSSDLWKDRFGPYECLIGEWDVKSESDGKVMAVQHGRWGPNRSYIWYSVGLVDAGREEPHFEGLLVWNGVHRNLDMLLVIDLKSGGAQEQGTISVSPDGVLVRDITAVYSAGVGPMGARAGASGGTAHFRQTYKKIDADKIMTSIMRETDHGWVASFPGSDHLVMTRRPGSS